MTVRKGTEAQRHKGTKYKIILILFVGFSLLAQQIHAANSQTGTTTASFLKIETGVRPVSMGGAYVAIADDINAVYWNPAGLIQLSAKEFSLVHTAWLEKINHESLAFAAPAGNKFAYGLHVVYFGTTDIDRRTVTGTSDGKAKVADYYESVSLAWKALDNINLGATFKGLQMTLDNDWGSGYALDVGALQKLPLNVTVGVMVQNLGPKMKAADTSEKLPTNLKAGLAWRTLENKLVLAGDIEVPNDREMKLHAGAEYRFNKLFALRTGYEDVTSPGNCSGFTAGLSINEDYIDEILNVKMQFDYAWMSFGDLGSTHRIGISIKF
ncbi:MAG: PorV/PorQ family protein [Elusimicrobia bacterium]|nr:PorV/PorQ family protein [Elusimicrobiota bacterium]